MQFIQQSYTSLLLGPFLSSSDGVTPLTGLAGSMVVYLSKRGATPAARASAGSITSAGFGYYHVPVDPAEDLDSLGSLKVIVNASGALPYWDNFELQREGDPYVITPIIVTVSAGQVVERGFEAYTGETKPLRFELLNQNGTALDETGHTMRMFFMDKAGVALGTFVDFNVAVNVITGSVGTPYTDTPGIYSYALWDIEDDVVRARGKMTLLAAPGP